MVTSDRPPPPRPYSPGELALQLLGTPRFAFFTDKRGVVYCEQVEHTILIVSALGKTMGGTPTRYADVVHWDGSESKFLKTLEDFMERGFTIERNMAYVRPNVWGEVKVLKEITDLKVGKKFRKICREGTPEAQKLFGDKTNLSAPDLEMVVDQGLIIPRAPPLQPFTNHILARITG